MSAVGANEPRPRGALRLLVDPVFGGIFWGKLLASAGVWMHSIVAAIVVFNTTGSALMVGLVSAVQFAPQLFLTPWSGTWADRGHAGRQILLGRILCAIGSGSLALWLWLVPTMSGDLLTGSVMIGSLLLGLGFVVGGPALQSIVPSLVRPGELTTAMALNTAPMMIGRIVGPILGAFVAGHTDAALAFGIACGLHLVFVLLILITPIPKPQIPKAGSDFSVRAAFRHLRTDRPLVMLLVAISVVGFGSEPAMTLTPSMAHELGGTSLQVGELAASFGIGSGIGVLLTSALGRRLRPSLTTAIGLWSLGLGMAGAGVAPTQGSAMLAFALSGLGFAAAMTGASTLIQVRVPNELRGRIMALWMVGFIGSRPLAASIVGTTSDLVSVRVAFAVTAVIVVVVAVLCHPRALAAPPPEPLHP